MLQSLAGNLGKSINLVSSRLGALYRLSGYHVDDANFLLEAVQVGVDHDDDGGTVGGYGSDGGEVDDDDG